MRFSEDIGIDLGTATFLIYTKSRGLVLQEPSVIAMTRDSKQVKAVGEEAYRMIGRTPGGIVAVHRAIRPTVTAAGTVDTSAVDTGSVTTPSS